MSFKVPDKKQIPEMEEEILSYWKTHNIFEKSVEKNSEDNLYVFYDGPPFISGLPHYGHLLVSIAKDVIPRFWTMKGKRVERVWGWDAHGLTVENRVQEELGIEKRRDIESFILPGGCRESSFLHLSRVTCRKLERMVFQYLKKDKNKLFVGKYLNRLSDLLFVMARYSNKKLGFKDIIWNNKES